MNMKKIMMTMMTVMLLSVTCAFAYMQIVLNPLTVIMLQHDTTSVVATVSDSDNPINGGTTVYIDPVICKDNGSGCIPLANPCSEISVVFNDTQTLSTQTNSNNQAFINVTTGPISANTVYRYRVEATNGGWQWAVVTADAQGDPSIPEFPIGAMPVLMSMAGFGLVFRNKL